MEGKAKAFMADVTTGGGAAESVATAFAKHLGDVDESRLSPEARSDWADIARCLNAPSTQPIQMKSINAIRSWPSARVAKLIAAVASMQASIEHAENERLQDRIRDEIRHTYL